MKHVITVDEFVGARVLYWNGRKNNKSRTLFMHNRLNSSYNCDGMATRNATGNFRYSVVGKTVCQTAFEKAFGISHGKLQEIQTRIRNDINGALLAVPDKTASTSRSPEYGTMFGWFAGYVDRLAETMPHTGDQVLPPSTWKSIYAEYAKDMGLDEKRALKYNTFVRMKNTETRFGKVRLPNFGSMGLKSCNECRKLLEIMHRAKSTKMMNRFRLLRKKHLQKASTERELYWMRRELARENPAKYLSIIIDGMDQKKTSLPYHPRESAETKNINKFKVHVAGTSHANNMSYTLIY